MASTSWKDLIGKAEAPQGFDPLPANTYEAEVELAEYKQTKTGKDMFMLTFRVTQGEYAGRKLWTNIVISPESPTALGIAFRDLATLGVTAEFLATEPSNEAICAKLVGGAARLKVVLRKDDPTRNEVDRISPSSSGAAAAFEAPSSAPAASSAPPSSPF